MYLYEKLTAFLASPSLSRVFFYCDIDKNVQLILLICETFFVYDI